MNPNALQGWVLFDDSCGFCRWWIPFWGRTLFRRGFLIAPLQAAWVRRKLQLPAESLLDDLRLLLVDGRMIQGADVYRHVLRKIWWAWPLYIFAMLPVGRSVFDWGYRTFANNRYRISHSCRMPPGRVGSSVSGSK